MVSLIQRRREMMQNGIILPEWDVEWDGTDGVYPSAVGFVTTGSASVSLKTMSVQVTTTSSKSARYNYVSDATIGVFEAEVAIWGTQSYFNMYFGDGENCISIRMQYSTNYKGFYLRDAENISDMTKIQSAQNETRYIVKLVLKPNNLGDVYIDDVLKVSDLDVTTIYSGGEYKGLVAGGLSSSGSACNIYHMKLKLGRIS